jgi:hypothetical protein
MKKYILTLIALFMFAPSYGAKQVTVLMERSTVLTFPGTIVDAELDAAYYAFSIVGANLLVKPKSADAPMRTLLVRYGKDSATFVADISPSIDAPSHWQWKDLVATTNASLNSAGEPKQVVSDGNPPASQKSDTQAEKLFENLRQQYWDLGCMEDGVVVMAPQIILHEKKTYIKIWIKNDTQTFLKLQAPSFENISYTWKYWIWRSKNSQPSVLTVCPDIEVFPKSQKSFIFAFPTFVTNGGIDIYLREDPSEGLRNFQFNIPAKVLLQAYRQ